MSTIYYAVIIPENSVSTVKKNDPERIATYNKKKVIYGLTVNLVKYTAEENGLDFENLTLLVGKVDSKKRFTLVD